MENVRHLASLLVRLHALSETRNVKDRKKYRTSKFVDYAVCGGMYGIVAKSIRMYTDYIMAVVVFHSSYLLYKMMSGL